MSYIGQPLLSTSYPIDQYVATADQTVFTLSQSPGSASALAVFLDGVSQEPGTAFTVSGTTLTFTSGVPLNTRVWVVHLGVRGIVNAPAANSVDSGSFSTSGLNRVTPVLMTPTSLSGATVDFTGIPTGVKRFHVCFDAMSLAGSANPAIQLGDAGGIETTGYNSTFGTLVPTVSTGSSTTDFRFSSNAAANLLYGMVTFVLMNSSTNLWAMSGQVGSPTNGDTYIISGTKALSAVLDRVRILAGVSTFDGGTANIIYEQ